MYKKILTLNCFIVFAIFTVSTMEKDNKVTITTPLKEIIFLDSEKYYAPDGKKYIMQIDPILQSIKVIRKPNWLCWGHSSVSFNDLICTILNFKKFSVTNDEISVLGIGAEKEENDCVFFGRFDFSKKSGGSYQIRSKFGPIVKVEPFIAAGNVNGTNKKLIILDTIFRVASDDEKKLYKQRFICDAQLKLIVREEEKEV